MPCGKDLISLALGNITTYCEYLCKGYIITTTRKETNLFCIIEWLQASNDLWYLHRYQMHVTEHHAQENQLENVPCHGQLKNRFSRRRRLWLEGTPQTWRSGTRRCGRGALASRHQLHLKEDTVFLVVFITRISAPVSAFLALGRRKHKATYNDIYMYSHWAQRAAKASVLFENGVISMGCIPSTIFLIRCAWDKMVLIWDWIKTLALVIVTIATLHKRDTHTYPKKILTSNHIFFLKTTTDFHCIHMYTCMNTNRGEYEVHYQPKYQWWRPQGNATDYEILWLNESTEYSREYHHSFSLASIEMHIISFPPIYIRI